MDQVDQVALDPPCFDNLSRYVDCGNGTVTDSVTGLVWLQDAGCRGAVDWATGSTSVASLADGECGLSDGSRSGQWRLPTVDEWRATIAPAVVMGCSLEGVGTPPALTNTAGTDCLSVGPTAFFGVASAGYWSRDLQPAASQQRLGHESRRDHPRLRLQRCEESRPARVAGS